jgi:hypothetical protein
VTAFVWEPPHKIGLVLPKTCGREHCVLVVLKINILRVPPQIMGSTVVLGLGHLLLGAKRARTKKTVSLVKPRAAREKLNNKGNEKITRNEEK